MELSESSVSCVSDSSLPLTTGPWIGLCYLCLEMFLQRHENRYHLGVGTRGTPCSIPAFLCGTCCPFPEGERRAPHSKAGGWVPTRVPCGVANHECSNLLNSSIFNAAVLGMKMLGGAAAEIQDQPELPTLGWVLGSRCCVHGCLFIQFSTVRVLVQSARPNSEHQLRCIPGFVLFCNAKEGSRRSRQEDCWEFET